MKKAKRILFWCCLSSLSCVVLIMAVFIHYSERMLLFYQGNQFSKTYALDCDAINKLSVDTNFALTLHETQGEPIAQLHVNAVGFAMPFSDDLELKIRTEKETNSTSLATSDVHPIQIKALGSISGAIDLYLPPGAVNELSLATAKNDLTLENMHLNKLNLFSTGGATVIKRCAVDDLTIKTQSADIQVSGCLTGFLDLSSHMGNITVEDCGVENLRASTLLGKLQVTGHEVVPQSIEAHTIIGNIDINSPAEETVYIKTTIGQVGYSGDVPRLSCHTIFSNVNCILGQRVKKIVYDGFAGNAFFYLPETASYVMEYQTMTGSLNDLFAQKSVRKSSGYQHGDNTSASQMIRFALSSTMGKAEVTKG